MAGVFVYASDANSTTNMRRSVSMNDIKYNSFAKIFYQRYSVQCRYNINFFVGLNLNYIFNFCAL